MKIGIFTETFLPQINGVVTSICNNSKFLVKKKHVIDVFSVGKESHKRIDGYNAHFFKGVTFRPYPDYKIFLPKPATMRFLKKQDLDIIHSHGPFTMGIAAYRLSRKRNIPLIGTYHTPVQDYIQYLPLVGRSRLTKSTIHKSVKKYVVWYFNRCKLVTAPSKIIAKELVNMGCKRPVTDLSNGVDMNKFRPKKSNLKRGLCKKNESLLLYVGRVAAEKNVEELIKLAELLKEGLEFKLLIVGKGPKESMIKNEVKRKGLDNIILFGGCSEKQLLDFYSSADLFISPSTVETQGIVFLEALSSGCPVVAANAGATPELIKNRKNGLLFKPHSIEDFAEKVEKALKINKNLRKNTRKSIEPHSIESVGKELERIYIDITK